MRKARGFTLIELMMTVAIVAILAAIAMPSYRKYIQKSNRAVAKTFLTQVIAREEAFYTDRKTYATTLSALGYPANTVYLDRDGTPQSTTGSNRIYSVTVCSASPCVAATTSTVWFRADPINIQNSPAEQCGVLVMSTAGDKAQIGGTISNCWKQ